MGSMGNNSRISIAMHIGPVYIYYFNVNIC